ncbi:MAG: DNA mismatch repair protein MutS [Bacteroidota bacterium]|nr:DNA mismatch repair protein MutS [Bacteroidota bacterium]
MNYLFFIAILAVLIFIFINYSNKRKYRKQISQIRGAWGNPKSELFNFDGIKNYSEEVRGNNFHLLTEQTIDDIDFHGLFEFIDRTTSKVGQQFLFRKVIEPTKNTNDSSQSLIELFTKDTTLREAIQLELLKLEDSNAYDIPSLLKGNLLKKPKWFKLLGVDIAFIICLIIFSFKYQVFIIFLVIPFALNTFLHFWNKSNSIQFFRSIPQLNLLINVTRNITQKDAFFHDKLVRESISNLKQFQLKSSTINFDNKSGVQSELEQMATYLWELIKAFFLIEVFSFFKVIKELESRRSSIITLFDYVGNIDTSISIASLRAGNLKTCQPVFCQPGKTVSVKNMYHPLIENCIENDLSISGKSILITGSNMSGKSTFLRTFTINSILAQTIYTCFAEEFICPILKHYSSIRIDDNLFQNKSYYLQEVLTIGSLIAEIKSPNENLFVLDEVFKGTNTIERISATKAILSYLNHNNNIVIISTHDIELSDMLKSEYDLYHFTETIENGELYFDHKIKRGQLKTRNAIKLLELANYPKEIIDEARQISLTL